MITRKIEEIPSGLMVNQIRNYSPKHTIANAYRHVFLEQAVDSADLNVTERMALNKKFFPHGGGFELFPKTKNAASFNIFWEEGASPLKDTFTREVEQLKLPEHVCRIKKRYFRSSKSNLQANLDNALKKLKKAVKNM